MHSLISSICRSRTMRFLLKQILESVFRCLLTAANYLMIASAKYGQGTDRLKLKRLFS